LIVGTNYLMIIRLLRVLRIFRILKLLEYMGEARILMLALGNARKKITVFVFALSVMAMIFGSLLYVIEGEANGFTSIPRSIYWAIVTITTVGYGDISPQTPLGQMVASVVMLMGYAIIAIPTGIVTAEIALLGNKNSNNALATDTECPQCHKHFHLSGANFCNNCGYSLAAEESEDSN
ncbi:MAG: ion transporter, partial [Sinobacterium sp.]|nr:ion transporter [Sinobacterium sp.]